MTGHGKFEPTTKGGSVNGGYHGLGTILNVAQARVYGTRALEGSCAGCDGLEETDVRARNERCARADQHYRPCRGIFSGALDGGFDGFRDTRAERVYGG